MVHCLLNRGIAACNIRLSTNTIVLTRDNIVDNKRPGAVLRLAQDKMDELDRHGKRVRNKSMPKRRAQLRVQEQRKAINPVLVNPEEFRASFKR